LNNILIILLITTHKKYLLHLGISRGNPGVFQGHPDPDPPKPIPMLRVWVLAD
jgi:hypothetical protein